MEEAHNRDAGGRQGTLEARWVGSIGRIVRHFATVQTRSRLLPLSSSQGQSNGGFELDGPRTRRCLIEVAEGLSVKELAHPEPDTLYRFLVAWHGPRQPDSGAPPEQLAGRSSPQPLRPFYALVMGWPGLITQNHLLEPGELREEDGRVIFYVENQHVRSWATAREGDDPPVWSRAYDPRSPWELEGEPLSRFLLQLVLFESIVTAPEGASAPCLNDEQLSRALYPLRPLPLAPWRWPAYPARFYGGAGILAVVSPNANCGGAKPSDYHDLFLGARRRDQVAYLDSLVDESWAYYSPVDKLSR